ncbi:Chitinase [Salmonella enterica subsp. enterica serovar Mississippi str. A4-633]|nr:Chitinase [Salmonella enterica subsp. enterica serovar Mississippi str. A4-633]VXG76307.1 Chitinase (EC 3.2.1.14) CDS [Salmonella enterica subsp. enterica serovar Derby]
MIKRNGMFSLTLYQLPGVWPGQAVNYPSRRKLWDCKKHWRSAP